MPLPAIATMQMSENFVTAIDFIGTFAFAISGATAGVRRGLDLFGVLVLSFAAATAGGIMRDTMLGATPPVALVDMRYIAISALACLITFYRQDLIERIRNPLQLTDAIGLGLFAVLGTSKALFYGVGPVGAVMLGILTGVGGGVVRDVLTMQIPGVLQRELYAVAALLGAVVVVAGNALQLPPTPVAVLGATACITLRFLAMRRGWQLPVAKSRKVDGGS